MHSEMREVNEISTEFRILLEGTHRKKSSFVFSYPGREVEAYITCIRREISSPQRYSLYTESIRAHRRHPNQFFALLHNFLPPRYSPRLLPTLPALLHIILILGTSIRTESPFLAPRLDPLPSFLERHFEQRSLVDMTSDTGCKFWVVLYSIENGESTQTFARNSPRAIKSLRSSDKVIRG